MPFYRSKIRLLPFSLVALLAASCASPTGLDVNANSAAVDLHELVAENVTDTNRRAQATALTSRMKKQISNLFKKSRELQGDLFDLNCDYDTTREQVRQKMAKGSRLRASTADQLVRLVLELRRNITEDEWTAIQAGMSPYRGED